MQRPRLIATPPVLARTEALIRSDGTAAAEYGKLVTRAETIFAMKLLSYTRDEPILVNIPPATPTASVPPRVDRQLAIMVPESFSSDTFGEPAEPPFTGANPLAPPPLPEPAAPPPGKMVPEALGFGQKGFAPFDVAKAALARLQALALIWRLDRQPKYLERAVREMRAICLLPHWGEEHFLAVAHFMQALAIGYDWLHDDLEPARRQEFLAAMLDKGVAPVLAAFAREPRPNWLRLANNWNVVCNASFTLAAMAIGPDTPDPRVARLRDLSLEALKVGVGLYGEDGSWRLEGPGYWHLATEHLVYLLAALEAAGGDAALADTAAIANTGLYRCYVSGPSRLLFNFGDCEEQRPGLWWMRWLGTRYDRAFMHELAEDRSGATGAAAEVHPMDMLWRRATVIAGNRPALAELPTARTFSELAVMRGAWGDPLAPYVAIKGGETSGRRSHSHLDLGHFVHEAGGVRWAIDLGAGAYTDCYLEPPWRYNFYAASSFGHNTLVLDGDNQAFRPAGDPRPAIAAALSQPQRQGGVTSVEADLTAAYPMATHVRRRFSLGDDGCLTIVDSVEAAAPLKSIEWSLHTRAAVVCEGQAATLTQAPAEGASARILRAELAGIDGATFECLPAGPPRPYGACSKPEDAIEDVRRLRIKWRPTGRSSQLTVRLMLT